MLRTAGVNIPPQLMRGPEEPGYREREPILVSVSAAGLVVKEGLSDICGGEFEALLRADSGLPDLGCAVGPSTPEAALADWSQEGSYPIGIAVWQFIGGRIRFAACS
jgi:hypothetical protein